jgi:hypothetical protein
VVALPIEGHLSAAERRRVQEFNRTALAYPYAAEYAMSMRRNFDNAREPQGLTRSLRWVRWAYSQEPPFRIHVSFRTGEDGDPALSGEFMDWVEGISSPSAGRQDHEDDCPWRYGVTKAARDLGVRGDCHCYYRWPLRFALWQMHGRFEDTPGAWLADLLLDVAGSHESLSEIGARHGIRPEWAVPFVVHGGLRRLWWSYSPMPRVGP